MFMNLGAYCKMFAQYVFELIHSICRQQTDGILGMLYIYVIGLSFHPQSVELSQYNSYGDVRRGQRGI